MASPDEVIGARLRTPRVKAVARHRVDSLLDGIWDHPISLVIAPAGSGKTTALAHFASRATDPIAWYRADGADGSVDRLLAHLEAALVGALDGLKGDWTTITAASKALERWPGRRATLVIDDLHAIRGTPAEAVLERLIDYLPPHIVVAAASRTAPSFDLTRLRLTGNLLEVGPDDLRFRTWETEQLFRDLYDTRLLPEDVARLTRRVEGWAAGLQLYHLASRSKPPAEQRRLIDVVSSRSRLAREYLTRNVLDELPDDLRTFLVDTCVLGVVTPGLADALLGTEGSAARLRDLEDLQLFTIPLDDTGTYRYHEVLRSHLEVLLAERDGEDALLQRHQRAGQLLADAGLTAEALRCFGRCGNWDAVSDLLGGDTGGQLSEAHRWLDSLPPSIVEHDPWLLLARARGETSAGRLRDAVASYQAAERLLGDTPAAEQCRRERVDVQGWLDPLAPPGDGWAALVRSGLRRDPRGAAARLLASGDPTSAVAAGILQLFTGDFVASTATLQQALVHPDISPRAVVFARLGIAQGMILGPVDANPAVVDEVESAAEQLGFGLLARQARATLSITSRVDLVDEAARVVEICDADGDPWGAAVARLLQGFGRLGLDLAAIDALTDAADRLRALDAPLLEASALGCLAVAMAREHHPEAATTARAAEHLARQVGATGARATALVALAALEPANSEALQAEADGLASEGGFRLPRDSSAQDTAPAPASRPAPARIEVRCFGVFTVRIDGAELDLSPLRPRARSAFRMLALHGGRPVHKEVLVDALWPGNDVESGVRSLQVALSAVRQLLGSAGGDAGALVARDGDSYRFAAADAAMDVRCFEDAVRTAAAATAAGDLAAAAAAAEHALELHRGDLLTEEGPAEWVVADRDKYRVDAANMAAILAEAELAQGRPAAAVGACERGLRIDRYNDGLWRLLADGHEASGDRAAAIKARKGYEAVMAELGVS